MYILQWPSSLSRMYSHLSPGDCLDWLLTKMIVSIFVINHSINPVFMSFPSQ